MKKRIASLFTSLLMIVSLMVVMPTMSVSAANGTTAYTSGVDPYPMYNNPVSIKQRSCTSVAWECVYANTGIKLPGWGNAMNWYANAPKSGFQTYTSTPMEGHLAIWADTDSDGNIIGPGHVAYILYVNTNTQKMTVYEGGRKDISTPSIGTITLSYVVGTFRGSQKLLGFINPGVANVPPTNVILSRNQTWYDQNDTIMLTPFGDGATEFYMSVEKDGTRIINGVLLNGSYSFTASTWGIGKYHAWITAVNGAGSTDSPACDFEVGGKPTYSTILTSKAFYDFDKNETVTIGVIPTYAKSQVIGIDLLDENLKKVKRVITTECETCYKVSAQTLGTGYYSAYFSLWNGVGTTDTKKVYFYVGQKQNLGTDFYARIKNEPANRYLTNSNGNVDGKPLDCSKQQIWKFVRQSDGGYKIISACDNTAMDVTNYGASGNGTNVQTFKDWDSTAQVFYIYYINQSYVFRPACSDVVLDLNGITSNLQIWSSGFNLNTQKFQIEKIESSDEVEHTFSDWKITKNASCTDAGIKERICKVCGKTETQTIAKTGHKSVTDKTISATCTTDGKTEGSHCSVCGAVIKAQDTIKATGHKFGNWTTIKPVTCTESGTQIRKCETCGATESKNLSAKGHTEVVDKAIPATCTTDGKTEGSHCSVCGAVIKAQDTIKATGHKFGNWTTIKPATCTESGTQIRKCENCGATESKSLSAKGHTEVVDKAIPATCTTDGKTEGSHCSVCNTVIKAQTTITATGHKSSGWITDKAASIGVKGSKHKECTVCKKVLETAEIPALSRISISKASVTLSTSIYAYDGKAKTPSVNVKVNGKTLKKDTDYTVSYSNNTKVGTAKVTITGKGNYTGSVSKTYSIKNNFKKATVSGISTKAFTGKNITQSITVKYNGKTLKKGTDYTVSYSNNKNIGTATVKIAGKGSYTGTITKTFKINPAKQEIQKLTAKSKAFFVDWAQKGSATGYEIQYATNSKFTSAKKVTITNNKTDTKTISKLSGKKKYYVRVRSYTTVKGTKYYGAWSSTKTVTTKK
jgi:surface antigen